MAEESDSTDSVICPYDGCEYESSQNGVKIHYGRTHEGSISGVDVECAHCGEVTNKPEYKLSRSKNLFCSNACHDKWRHENVSGEDAGGWRGGIGKKEFTCSNCGTTKSARRDRVDNFKHNFCGESCMAEYYASGYVPSGEDHKWYGTDRSGKKASLYGVTGKDHPAWKGGHDGNWRRTDDNRWRRLSEKVRKRDNNRCQRCRGYGELHVHHIKPVSEGGAKYNTENLITLCMSCHNDVHRAEYDGMYLNEGD